MSEKESKDVDENTVIKYERNFAGGIYAEVRQTASNVERSIVIRSANPTPINFGLGGYKYLLSDDDIHSVAKANAWITHTVANLPPFPLLQPVSVVTSDD